MTSVLARASLRNLELEIFKSKGRADILAMLNVHFLRKTSSSESQFEVILLNMSWLEANTSFTSIWLYPARISRGCTSLCSNFPRELKSRFILYNYK
jgi:hypothetical protein